MRLQRNITEDQTCKYAIVRLDKIRSFPKSSIRTPDIENGLGLLQMHGVLELGKPGDDEECFVIKLKDAFTVPALDAYIRSVNNRIDYLRAIGQPKEAESLVEYVKDLAELQARANIHPKKHYPD